jgi:selenocysteine-specific elongation factor
LPGFPFPSGTVGIVDVPGHHRLVKNMLAGVGLVDFVLLVIAADDGWMPQTQEHMEIIDLYGIKRGIVALTKADLVDPEWLELVQADISERLAATSLGGRPDRSRFGSHRTQPRCSPGSYRRHAGNPCPRGAGR